MFQITILFLYTVAALAFALSRFPQFSARSRLVTVAAFVLCIVGIILHSRLLYAAIMQGGSLSLATAASLIGLQLAVIGTLGAVREKVRGMSAGLLLLAALTLLAHIDTSGGTIGALSWQLQAHVMTSMFAYGLLTAGAIVAVFALVQDQRLRSARLSTANYLFAPLETTEKMLFAVSASGFTVLALSVVSGIAFVDDLFAQHLVHKTALTLLALLLFGILLLGRQFAGWRGKRAIYLYLASFAVLSLGYFGSRFILEELLGRSWG